MKKTSVFGFMLFLTLCITAFSFPAYSKACECLSEGFSITHSNSIEITSMNLKNSTGDTEKEKPLFENIIIYLIIFTPVIVITMGVWILNKIFKSTKIKE